MAENSSFRDLIAWQKAMDLVETCYEVASALPRSETFGLAAQLRRAAVSVPANIAEGQRLSKGAFRNYLRTALGSEAEIETQLELARRLRLIEPARAAAAIEQAGEVARVIRGLLKALARRS